MGIHYDEFKETLEIVANKIFTTFTKREDLDSTLDKVKANYTILWGKIFVFSSPDTEEYICTYNVDQNNCTTSRVIENTVLLHRKKVTKTLFSINAINILNKQGDAGINWEDYTESILLTRKGQFTQIKLDLHDIIYVEA